MTPNNQSRGDSISLPRELCHSHINHTILTLSTTKCVVFLIELCRFLTCHRHELSIATILTAVKLFPREASGRRVERGSQAALRPAVLGSFIPRESFAVGKFGASFATFAGRVGLEQ